MLTLAMTAQARAGARTLASRGAGGALAGAAALCGLALGAAGAEADRDLFEALFARCVGSVIETHVAMQAGFPDHDFGLRGEATLLMLRHLQENPGMAFRTSSSVTSKFETVNEMCKTADELEDELAAALEDVAAADFEKARRNLGGGAP